MAKVYDLNGKEKGEVELPMFFTAEVKPDLIKRAVLAESSFNLQPQGHFVLAGMQTTATYYGAMNEYRSGRHMGIAIRPREKLGGGRQGKVKRIPSAVKGKRAHPHMVEKKIKEGMNKREYQKALTSSMAASLPKSIIVDDGIEAISRTKEIIKAFDSLKLHEVVERGRAKRLKKGLRRGSVRRHFRKSLLLVVSKGSAVKAASNLPGVDAVTINHLTVSAFAPGGNAGRHIVYSVSAIKGIADIVKSVSLSTQYKYSKGLSR